MLWYVTALWLAMILACKAIKNESNKRACIAAEKERRRHFKALYRVA